MDRFRRELSRSRCLLLHGQDHLQRDRDLLSDLILNAEDVVQIAIIALRPQVMPGDSINKLGCDTDLITDLPDASVQDISHAQLTAHLRDLYRPVLVRESRIARDHGEPTDLREIGDDIVSDAAGSWSTGTFPRRVAKRRRAAPSGNSKRPLACPGPACRSPQRLTVEVARSGLKLETPHVASRDAPRGTAF
jgi:hypothetical protein